MKTYHVTFNTKETNVNKTIQGFNVRFAKHVIERLLELHPEFIHVQLFTKNGVHSKSRKNNWIFYNEKRR